MDVLIEYNKHFAIFLDQAHNFYRKFSKKSRDNFQKQTLVYCLNGEYLIAQSARGWGL